MNIIQKKRIIVIGGGYAGISLIHKLKNNSNIELILIDKSQKHLLQTHIHKYLSGHYNKEDITFNHETYCNENNIKFICDEVTSINYENNCIVTGQEDLHHYDYVVVATGAVSIFPKQIENVIEYTKDIKHIDNLDYYRDKFLKLIDLKPNDANIVVVGGGVSGLQIACEYAHTISKNGLCNKNIQVTIVEGMDSLLPGLDPYLINKSEARCKQLGIKVINKLFASKVLEDKIILSNGDELSYNMLLFVIGTIGNSIININDEVLQNERNQLIVDDFYRIIPYKNSFAIGDIVQAKDIKTDNFQSPTAQASRMQAELTAKNIIKSMKRSILIENNISNKGILIDLGGENCSIGRLFNINLCGKPALWCKKLIYS